MKRADWVLYLSWAFVLSSLLPVHVYVKLVLILIGGVVMITYGITRK
jgi:hypothetical protein